MIKLKTLSEHNTQILQDRKKLNGRAGIMCPKCRSAEMFFEKMAPVQTPICGFRVKCPVCGHRGIKYV